MHKDSALFMALLLLSLSITTPLSFATAFSISYNTNSRTTLITNETGQVVEEITYEPYGRIFEGQAERFAYTGKELDLGTGLEYYGARYYDPNRGQFTQADSSLPNVYDPQQLNRYA